MSQRKDGTLFYTKEELNKAIENSSALEYAQSRYQLKRIGNRYTMPEHDSMVFTQDGKWFWNSHGVHGNALDFMQKYEGKSFVEAVLTLAGTILGLISTNRVLSQLGTLIGRGAVLSFVLVIFVLPSLLILFDGLIRKTTLRADFYGTGKQNTGPTGGAGPGSGGTDAADPGVYDEERAEEKNVLTGGADYL